MIKIDFKNNFKGKGCSFGASQAKSIASKIISKISPEKGNTTIEVILLEKTVMKKINSDLRNIDLATDVLSFPQSYLPKAKEKILGSILIAPEVAEEENINCEKLFIHGVLHLLGFDHETNKHKWQNTEKIIKEI